MIVSYISNPLHDPQAAAHIQIDVITGNGAMVNRAVPGMGIMSDYNMRYTDECM